MTESYFSIPGIQITENIEDFVLPKLLRGWVDGEFQLLGLAEATPNPFGDPPGDPSSSPSIADVWKYLKITDEFGTIQCTAEVEFWDDVNKYGKVNIRIPALTLGQDKIIKFEKVVGDQQVAGYIDLLGTTIARSTYDRDPSNWGPSKLSDDFIGNDNDPPDTDRWTRLPGQSGWGTILSVIDTNRLKIQSTQGVKEMSLTDGLYLVGDFSASVDISIDLPGGGTDLVALFSLYLDANNQFYGAFWSGADGPVQVDKRISGSTTNLLSKTNTGAQTVNFKFTRTGSTVDWDVNDGAYSGSTSWISDNIVIRFQINCNSTAGEAVFIDNLVFTSGQVQNIPDSKYKAVYRAQDPSGGAGSFLDSTASALNGTPSGMIVGDLLSRSLGKAVDFDGTDNAIHIVFDEVPPNGEFIQAFYKLNGWGEANTGRITLRKPGFALHVDQTNGRLEFNADYDNTDGRWWPTDANVQVLGEQYFLEVDYDLTGDPTIRLDGSAIALTEDSTPSGNIQRTVKDVYIGSSEVGSRWADMELYFITYFSEAIPILEKDLLRKGVLDTLLVLVPTPGLTQLGAWGMTYGYWEKGLTAFVNKIITSGLHSLINAFAKQGQSALVNAITTRQSAATALLYLISEARHKGNMALVSRIESALVKKFGSYALANAFIDVVNTTLELLPETDGVFVDGVIVGGFVDGVQVDGIVIDDVLVSIADNTVLRGVVRTIDILGIPTDNVLVNGIVDGVVIGTGTQTLSIDCKVVISGKDYFSDSIGSLSISKDKDSIHNQVEITFIDYALKDFLIQATNAGSPVDVYFQGRVFRFILEPPMTYSDGAGQHIAVSGRSMSVLDDIDEINVLLTSERSVSSIITENLNHTILDFQIDDWNLPIGFQFSGTAIGLIADIINIIPGVYAMAGDYNTIKIAYDYKVRPIDLATAPGDVLIDGPAEIIDLSSTMEKGDGYNEIVVYGKTAGNSSPAIEVEESPPIIKNDIHLRLYHLTAQGIQGVLSTYVTNGTLGFLGNRTSQIKDELVVFEGGVGSTQYPINTLDSFAWVGDAGTAPAYTSFSNQIYIGDSEYRLARVNYTVEYLYYVLKDTVERDVLILWVLDTLSDISVRVKFLEGGNLAPPISEENLTSESISIIAGRNFLDLEKYNLQKVTMETLFKTNMDPGAIASIDDSEANGNFYIDSIEINITPEMAYAVLEGRKPYV